MSPERELEIRTNLASGVYGDCPWALELLAELDDVRADNLALISQMKYWIDLAKSH